MRRRGGRSWQRPGMPGERWKAAGRRVMRLQGGISPVCGTRGRIRGRYETQSEWWLLVFVGPPARGRACSSGWRRRPRPCDPPTAHPRNTRCTSCRRPAEPTNGLSAGSDMATVLIMTVGP
jgi:hypothetical protein